MILNFTHSFNTENLWLGKKWVMIHFLESCNIVFLSSCQVLPQNTSSVLSCRTEIFLFTTQVLVGPLPFPPFPPREDVLEDDSFTSACPLTTSVSINLTPGLCLVTVNCAPGGTISKFHACLIFFSPLWHLAL